MNRTVSFVTLIVFFTFCNVSADINFMQKIDICNDSNEVGCWDSLGKRNIKLLDGSTSEMDMFVQKPSDNYKNCKFFKMFNKQIERDSTICIDEIDGVRDTSEINIEIELGEIREIDYVQRTFKVLYPDGMLSELSYDEQGRILKFLISNNGVILYKDEYFWGKNGRLEKTIMYGIERKYIYGKSISDMIKVVPSDKDICRHFCNHSGYDGTVGQIPEEGDPDYEIFAKSPYTFHRQK